MKRRNFIATALGALTASSVNLPATPVPVDPLKGMHLLGVTGVRGHFKDGVFVRVFDRVIKNDDGTLTCVVNPDYHTAPLEIEIWSSDKDVIACVAKERETGDVVMAQTCGMEQ